MSNGVIQHDESRWPYVVVTLPARELTDSEYVEYLDGLKRYRSRREPFGFVLDVRMAPPLNAERRRLTAERMDQDIQPDGRGCIGVAVVLSSPVARAVFKAIGWLRQRPYPFVAVSSVEQGLAWLRTLATAPDNKKH